MPVAIGIATAMLAGSAGGFAPGLLALLPWLAGVAAAVLLGPWLPSLRLPTSTAAATGPLRECLARPGLVSG